MQQKSRSILVPLLCLTWSLASGEALAAPGDLWPYYPKEFKSLVANPLSSPSELMSSTFLVLNSAHIVQDKTEDTLATRCPSDSSCYKHHVLGYTLARRVLLGRLHLEKEGSKYFIRCAYCEQRFGEEDFPRQGRPGPDEIPDVRVVNTEHTWPQSRFSNRFSSEMQKSDLHILFPVRAEANSLRNNNEFGDIVSRLFSICPSSALGYTSWGDNDRRFEPPVNHKGNVARALFYFATRYRSKISEQQESYLRKWHRQDPVDEAERQRNDQIAKLQLVRNPFIDYPDLVERISDF